MAELRPFACLRACPELASEVAAPPYDVFSRSEAAAEIAAHPHSFLRIDKSCALLPASDEYAPEVYRRAAELLADDVRAGVYLTEERPSYYLYRLEQAGHSQTGLLATVATEEYRTGVVRRHENTRRQKREDRIQHLLTLGAQTGPVLLAYRPEPGIDALVAGLLDSGDGATVQPPSPSQPVSPLQPQPSQPLDTCPVPAVQLYDFTAPDGVRHTVWRVDDEASCRQLTAAFAAVPALYIADGHHRAAAAAEVGGSHFLALLFPADQLHILDYNRIVAGLGSIGEDEFFARLAAHFELTRVGGASDAKPTRRGCFGLYYKEQWYALELHEALRPSDVVGRLDVECLHRLVLEPLLGITDARSDPRISYVGGARGLDELERRVDALDARLPLASPAPTATATDTTAPAADSSLAFALFPCTLDELFAVADEGLLMPPKSTWFEPKPRSGLFVYPFGELCPGARPVDTTHPAAD